MPEQSGILPGLKMEMRRIVRNVILVENEIGLVHVRVQR